jgi:DNA-binding transcriptional ArsR family regulator
MFDSSADALNRIFRALASEPRRQILRLTAQERCSITQLATQLNMSHPAVCKDVRVLVDAKMVSKTREGRRKWWRLKPRAFGPAYASIQLLHAQLARPRPAGTGRTMEGGLNHASAFKKECPVHSRSNVLRLKVQVKPTEDEGG